jgi:hypothetical protein
MVECRESDHMARIDKGREPVMKGVEVRLLLERKKSLCPVSLILPSNKDKMFVQM